jgi:hypothetical protein
LVPVGTEVAYHHLFPRKQALLIKVIINYMDLGEIGWDGRDWIELAQDGD